jgi:hypothetical protein
VRPTASTQKQHFITVERAPDPSDIWWHNCTAAGWQRQLRYLMGWAIWVLLLAVSAAIQVLLTRLAEHERSDRIEAARSGGLGGVRFPSPFRQILTCSRV